MTQIALVGEAWGAEEAEARAPFVGASGKLLNEMLASAGISRGECFVTNVFNFHPPKNDIEFFFGGAKDHVDKTLPKFGTKYLLKKWRPEVDRLYRELKEVHPHVIIALGNTPSWALLGQTAISKIRGYIASSPYGKVLPAYHPAAILREWYLRPCIIMDFKKALRESASPDIRRPKRTIYVEPTLQDLSFFEAEFLHGAQEICIDIETSPKHQQITCIGFAPSKDVALVVPFWDWRHPGWAYWPTLVEEQAAWQWCKHIIESPVAKLNQNILFDAYYLWAAYGIEMRNISDDTMLQHHSMFPESQKDLGFLASLYTDEMSWKAMRKSDSLKKEE